MIWNRKKATRGRAAMGHSGSPAPATLNPVNVVDFGRASAHG
jgi:hypothetical protein